MKYVYQRAKHDEAIIREYKERLSKDSLDALVEKYNREARCGIGGVHRQALYLIALRKEFLERLEQSPIAIEDHRSLGRDRHSGWRAREKDNLKTDTALIILAAPFQPVESYGRNAPEQRPMFGTKRPDH